MRRKSGYTLIEIMVALSVFAILAVITATAMHHAFTTRSKINEQANRLSELQLAMTIMQRDAEQIINRSIRGPNMILIPTFKGDSHYMEFTRDGLVNPNSLEKRSTLKRIAYICHNNKMFRRSWIRVDTTHREQFSEKLILDNLKSCSFAYLAGTQVLSEWKENAQRPNQHKIALPAAIQMTFTLPDWGNTSLLFIIPEGLYGT